MADDNYLYQGGMPVGFRDAMSQGGAGADPRMFHPGQNPYFSFAEPLSQIFGGLGAPAGMALDYLLPMLDPRLGGMLKADYGSFAQIQQGVYGQNALMGMQGYNQQQQLASFSQIFESRGVPDWAVSGASQLALFMGMGQHLPGGALTDRGLSQLYNAESFGQFDGFATSQSAMSSLRAFNSYYGFGPDQLPDYTRTAGLSQDDLADIYLYTRQHEVGTGISNYNERVSSLINETQRAFTNTVAAGLGMDSTTLGSRVSDLTASGMASGEALASALTETGMSEEDAAQAIENAKIQISADPSGLSEEARGILDEFGVDAFADRGTLERRLRMADQNMESYAEAFRSMKDSGFSGSFEQMIDSMEDVFGRQSVVDPSRIEFLSQRLGALAEMTGTTIGQVMNFFRAMESIPGMENLSDLQTLQVGSEALAMGGTFGRMVGLSQVEQGELATDLVQSSVRVMGSTDQFMLNMVEAIGTDQDISTLRQRLSGMTPSERTSYIRSGIFADDELSPDIRRTYSDYMSADPRMQAQMRANMSQINEARIAAAADSGDMSAVEARASGIQASRDALAEAGLGRMLNMFPGARSSLQQFGQVLASEIPSFAELPQEEQTRVAAVLATADADMDFRQAAARMGDVGGREDTIQVMRDIASMGSDQRQRLLSRRLGFLGTLGGSDVARIQIGDFATMLGRSPEMAGEFIDRRVMSQQLMRSMGGIADVLQAQGLGGLGDIGLEDILSEFGLMTGGEFGRLAMLDKFGSGEWDSQQFIDDVSGIMSAQGALMAYEKLAETDPEAANQLLSEFGKMDSAFKGKSVEEIRRLSRSRIGAFSKEYGVEPGMIRSGVENVMRLAGEGMDMNIQQQGDGEVNSGPMKIVGKLIVDVGGQLFEGVLKDAELAPQTAGGE